MNFDQARRKREINDRTRQKLLDGTLRGSAILGMEPTPKRRSKRQAPPGPPGGGGKGGGGFHGTISESFEREASFLSSYLNLGQQLRKNISHQFDEGTSILNTTIRAFVVTCSYAGEDCLNDTYVHMQLNVLALIIKACNISRLWLTTFSPTYGNCYTFNSKHNARTNYTSRRASLTGMSNGFSVELYLDQGNYMLHKLSKKAGARLVVHDPALPPIPDEYGIDLAPNTASSVAVHLVSLEINVRVWHIYTHRLRIA